MITLGLRFQMKLATLLCALERVLTVNWSDAMLPGLLDSRYVGGCMPVIIYSVRGGSDRCSGVMTASVVFLGPGNVSALTIGRALRALNWLDYSYESLNRRSTSCTWGLYSVLVDSRVLGQLWAVSPMMLPSFQLG